MTSNPEAAAVLKKHVGDAETLVWCDKPKPGFVFDVAFFARIVITLLSCGVILVTFRDPRVFLTLSPALLFLLVPVASLASIALDPYVRQHTYYGITDERVVIVRPALFGRVKSLPLSEYRHVEVLLHNDGRGTLRLRHGAPSAFSSDEIVGELAMITNVEAVKAELAKLMAPYDLTV